MKRPGRALYAPEAAKWPPLVRQVSSAIGAPEAAIFHAATAVELIIGTLDVVDDIIDDELEAELPVARATNAVLALLTLAEVAAQPLEEIVPAGRLRTFRSTVHDALITATQGEDLDILFEDRDTVSEQEALDMTIQKSGALMAMAFRMAGCLGTDDSRVLEALGRLGTEVGIVAQLRNDAEACTQLGAARSSDLARRKKTLPIAYALQCAQTEQNREFLAFFADRAQPASAEQLAGAQRYIAECGGQHYTWIVSEAARQRAEANLRQLGDILGDQAAEALRGAIPPVPTMQPMG